MSECYCQEPAPGLHVDPDPECFICNGTGTPDPDVLKDLEELS